MAYAVLFDGHVERGQVYLALSNFHVKDNAKHLPLNMYGKIALYVILAAKYGVVVKGVYVRRDAIVLYFDIEYAAKMFSLMWADFSRLWIFGREQSLYTDHIFKKLEGVRKHVEDYVNKLRIEYILYNLPGVDPWVEVRFKDGTDNEVAHINIRWHQGRLDAVFSGSREKVECLVSILNALGAKVEAKEYGGVWSVQLTTDSITEIRQLEWLDAVRALVVELNRRGIIDDRQKDRLLTKISAGSNVVEILGIKLNVMIVKTSKYKWLEIMSEPRSSKTFNVAVNALRL